MRILEQPGLFKGYQRCEATGNPVGTDTWAVGRPCECAACQDYLANSRPVVREERARIIVPLRARGATP